MALPGPLVADRRVRVNRHNRLLSGVGSRSIASLYGFGAGLALLARRKPMASRPHPPDSKERRPVRTAVTAISIAVLAALSLTGCSTTTTPEESPSASASPSQNATGPKGYLLTAPGNASQTANGEAIIVGSADGIEFIHSASLPKISLNSADGAMQCQVQDNMNESSAAAFAKGALGAGVDDFMKEDTGNAFPVKLRDFITTDEAHRFIEPAKGAGLLLSCFGPESNDSLAKAWVWVAANLDVAVVDSAAAGKIADPKVVAEPADQ